MKYLYSKSLCTPTLLLSLFFMMWLTIVTSYNINNNNNSNNSKNENNYNINSKNLTDVSNLMSSNLTLNNKSELRQSTFLEWLASIFRPIGATATAAATTTTTVTATKPPILKPKECPPCSCGSANNITRIVGGQETQVHQYPWMVMLRLRGRFYCGGSLINNLYIASAAHCLKNFPISLLSVRLMAHNLHNRTMHTIDRKVKQIYVHEKYSTRNFDSDIALIKLSEPIELTDKLRPVCMPHENKHYAHEEAIITGWGTISEGGSLADALQEVRVPVLSQEECRNSTYGTNRITDNMLCAGQLEGGKDSCQGDSGGPLHIVVKETNTYHLAGIVSWGEGCARPNKPGVYTRVSQFLSWIKEKTKDSCKCDVPIKKQHN